MIELIVNNVSLDLSERTRIGLTILSSDITSLNARTGDFTNTFTIPATKRNMNALEHVNLVTSSTNLPYRIVRATFKIDGIEIASNAYCVINSVTIDSITLNIFTGNLDFIKAIGDMKVSDLYINESSIEWNRTNVINASSPLVFPLIKWREDSTMFSTTADVDARELLPCLKFNDLLDKLSDEIGYSIDANLDSDIIITPNNFISEAESFELIKTNSNAFPDQKLVVSQGDTSLNIIRTLSFNTPQTGEFSNNRFSPTVNRFGVLSFNCQIVWYWKRTEEYGIFESEKTRNFDTKVSIIDDLGTVIKQIQLPTIATKLKDYGWSGDYLDVTIESPLMSFLSARNYRVEVALTIYRHDNINSEFEISSFQTVNSKTPITPTLSFQSTDALVYGNDIKVSNMFDMKVVDVIKEVINSYQIMITTDNYINKVTFNYLEDLITNKTKSIDWSNKILSVEGVGFTIPNLAKRNHLRYNYNDSLPNDSDSYFDVENENLKLDTTLVQLKSEMTRTYKGYNDETICLIDGINSNYEWKNPQWRILELDTKNMPFTINYNDGAGSNINYIDIPFAVFRNFDYLRTNYFNVLEDISSDAKVINATVNLTPLDLQNLRSNFIPIWIYSSKFSIDGYFHVNKIENYKNNIAQVELIRL